MPSEKLPLLTTVVVRHRDGARCVYCGFSLTAGAALTVDHLLPRVWGGRDAADNLVTCCSGCNTLKGTMNLAAFVLMVDTCLGGLDEGHWTRLAGRTGQGILNAVAAAVARPLDYDAAERIILDEKLARRRR